MGRENEFEVAIDELIAAIVEAAHRVWEKYPWLTAKEVETAIEASVRPLTENNDELAKEVFRIAALDEEKH